MLKGVYPRDRLTDSIVIVSNLLRDRLPEVLGIGYYSSTR